ncbi:hypothetical protein [Pseudodesulfovibrio sp.]|uniref:hypothetical protein n=1 Tax=unclassified Pseudodesulfovibrio TaxID=2661612 RepID=UPI003B00B55F
MQEYTSEELERRLGEFVELPADVHLSEDLNAALRLAELLQSTGYAFELKDMNPKSFDTNWRASFCLGKRTFESEDSQSALAICTAALAALEGTEA